MFKNKLYSRFKETKYLLIPFFSATFFGSVLLFLGVSKDISISLSIFLLFIFLF